jgi:hypothetical protein
MCEFSKNATHRFLSETWISINNFGDAHPGSQRLENKRDRNAGASNSWASAQVIRVSNDPSLHVVSLRLVPGPLKRSWDKARFIRSFDFGRRDLRSENAAGFIDSFKPASVT